MTQPARLQHFPISWFAMVMGLAGFTVAWHRAEMLLGLPVQPSRWLLFTTVSVFSVLVLFYGAKIIRYPQAVRKEFAHPIKLNFFPTFSIALLLLSIALLPHWEGLSFYLWASGAVLHLSFTLPEVSE